MMSNLLLLPSTKFSVSKLRNVRDILNNYKAAIKFLYEKKNNLRNYIAYKLVCFAKRICVYASYIYAIK